MMKINIYNKVLGLALAALTFTACSDEWDDHYSAPSASDGTTIWQTISSDADLSNFAKVMQATGYDKALASSQVFTVFAPVNASFTEADADEVIALYEQQKAANIKERDNRALKEFVFNHLALYNYSTTGKTDSITMMNGKYLEMTDTMLANSKMLTKNQLKSNGVLFTMEEPVNFFPNVYEYLSVDQDVDSIGQFMSQYNAYQFVANQSVPGGINDGKTWYLDSVKVLTNELFYELGLINSEDSTFWMVAPTNQVWNRLVPEYEAYFNYDNKVEKRDSLAFTEPRLALLRGTVFSRTRNTDASIQDSVLSVNATAYSRRTYKDQRYYQYTRPFDEGGVFDGTEVIPCSNGQVMKSNDWHIDKKQTFLQTIIVEGESRTYRDGINETTTATPTEMTVSTSNEFYNAVSQHKYLLIKPTAQSAAEVRYKIPNVLSNVGYDLYVVFAPTASLDNYNPDDPNNALDRDRLDKPVKFRASYSYHNQDGTQSSSINLTVPDFYDAAVRGSGRDFQTIAGQVDTLMLGENIQFPTCSWGLRDPQVLLTLSTALRNADRRDGTFTDRMRIDCIILKPHEEQAGEE